MSQPLRVLHVIASVSPRRGGPSVVVRNITEALRRRGVHVDLVTTDDDGDDRRLDVPFDAPCLIDGQRVRYFPRQTRRYGASYPLLRWLRRSVRDYDVVHTHGLFAFAPLAAAWQSRAAGVPYVMRPAGMLDTWGMRNKSALVKMSSVRLLEGPLLRGAAAVHFTSDLERRRAAALAIGVRSILLPLGFDFDSASADDARTPDELAAGGLPVILYMSRIHEVKCVDRLLTAYANLPHCERTILAIAGDGEPVLVERLKSLAQRLGVAHCVRWLGFAAGARKRRLLAGATLFVLPSASENFGVAIAEAMHAGLPVIVTQGAGLADLVASAGAGLVTDGSTAGLQAALQQLLTDPELRLSMGAAGRRAVHQQLSLDAVGGRLEGLYRSVERGAVLGSADASPGGLPP